MSGTNRSYFACALLAAGALLLSWNLGRPALWQDEAETALRAVSILETGWPRTSLRGVRVTAQLSLERHEGNAAGVWTWNTWLPAYMTAASFIFLGRTPFAARLPFVLAGLLAAWLAWRLFRDGEADLAPAERRPWAPELGLALLLLSPAYLLFARQARYYALAALGAVLVLRSWRRLLAGGPRAALALALCLQCLLHSSFVFFGIAALALAMDAALRGRECLKPRFFKAAALSAALSIPALWYFRAWERPGNHAYGGAETFEFLKTFLLWLALFAVPPLLPAAAGRGWRGATLALAGFALLCGLCGEGWASRASAGLALGWIFGAALLARAPRGAMSLRRLAWLWLGASLLLLSVTAAEPYGRYLMIALPALAYLAGRWLSEAARGRLAVATIAAAFVVGTNWLGWLPLRTAVALAGAAASAESVSGMMRQRLRDVRPRSDLAALVAELVRGPQGYVEPVATAIKAGGGGSLFSDADNLSFLFAAGAEPVYPDELPARRPNWLLPSPWLRLDLAAQGRVQTLLSSGQYEPADVSGPWLLWQNNPDPLFRDFAPRSGPLPLYRRRRPDPVR